MAAMSLYYEAVSFLSPASSKEGSLKSRIFKTASNLKSSPATIYALISETAKYNSLLKEVIDNAGLLALESKVSRPSPLVHFD
jgi:25S rRNA (cytosine2278-C5)-methyltransferase